MPLEDQVSAQAHPLARMPPRQFKLFSKYRENLCDVYANADVDNRRCTEHYRPHSWLPSMFGRTVLNHRSHTSTSDYQSDRAPYRHSSTENQGITWWRQQDPTVPNAPQALVADLEARHKGLDLPKHVLPVYPPNIYCVKGHYAFDPNPHNWMSTTDPANPIHQATEVPLPPLDFMAGCNIATCADSQDEHHDHVEQAMGAPIHGRTTR